MRDAWSAHALRWSAHATTWCIHPQAQHNHSTQDVRACTELHSVPMHHVNAQYAHYSDHGHLCISIVTLL